MIIFPSKTFLVIFTFKRETRNSEHVVCFFFFLKAPSNEGISIHIQNPPTIKGKTIKNMSLQISKWSLRFIFILKPGF